jgi:hypothetical protein
MLKRKCGKSKYQKCWILNETVGKLLILTSGAGEIAGF